MSLLDRAREALLRSGGWLDREGEVWLVRTSPDRRRRAFLSVGEAVVVALRRDPGLLPRPAGGWVLAGQGETSAPARVVQRVLRKDPDGRDVQVVINRGESPIAWLARRTDRNGRPWLSPPEIMAAERLREDFERSGVIGRLTMDWTAPPKDRTARGPDLPPRTSLARRRVRRALQEVGPDLRDILEQVCLYGSALQAAERELGLPSRTGKVRLKLALGRLAEHYRLV